MRLIDADALFVKEIIVINKQTGTFSRSVMSHVIEVEPTIDAAPVVHAKWLLTHTPIPAKVSYDGWMHCPECY